MCGPLRQFTSALIHHIRLCRSTCSQQKAFLERLVIFFSPIILVTLKGKYLPSFLCLKNGVESVVSSSKKNKGFTVVKCQRRQSSCNLLVQLCHAVFENVVFLLVIFLKQSVHIPSKVISLSSPWAPRLCLPPDNAQSRGRTPGEAPSSSACCRLYSGSLPQFSSWSCFVFSGNLLLQMSQTAADVQVLVILLLLS